MKLNKYLLSVIFMAVVTSAINAAANDFSVYEGESIVTQDGMSSMNSGTYEGNDGSTQSGARSMSGDDECTKYEMHSMITGMGESDDESIVTQNGAPFIHSTRLTSGKDFITAVMSPLGTQRVYDKMYIKELSEFLWSITTTKDENLYGGFLVKSANRVEAFHAGIEKLACIARSTIYPQRSDDGFEQIRVDLWTSIKAYSLLHEILEELQNSAYQALQNTVYKALQDESSKNMTLDAVIKNLAYIARSKICPQRSDDGSERIRVDPRASFKAYSFLHEILEKLKNPVYKSLQDEASQNMTLVETYLRGHKSEDFDAMRAVGYDLWPLIRDRVKAGG